MITEMFTTKEQIVEFLKTCGVKQSEYKIHENLVVEFLGKIGTLMLHNVDIKIIPFNFTNVQHISLSKTFIESLENINFPDGLKTLYITNSPLKNTKGIPNTVTRLDISHTLIEYFENLPEKLNTLYANNTFLKNTNNIPSTVEYLDIFNTPIKTLENLPNSLEYIIIPNKFLKNKKGMPSSVKGIKGSGSKWFSNFTFIK